MSISSLDAVDRNVAGEFDSDIKIKYRGNTDRPEESHKDCLTFLFYLVYALVGREYDGKASHKEYQHSKAHQTVGRKIL
jgi:hypothetical protein